MEISQEQSENKHDSIADGISKEKQHQNQNDVPLLDDPALFSEGDRDAYLTLVGSFFGLAGTLAFANSAGTVQSYLSTHVLKNVSSVTIGWIFSVNSCLSFGLTLISGPIFDHFGCRRPVAVGTICMTVGLMCFSLSTTTYQVVLSYSILVGFGTALTFGPFLGVLSHHFLKLRGRAMGLAYIGGASSGMCFPLMNRSLFPKLGFGWTIRIGAFITMALLTTGMLLVNDRREVFRRGQKDVGLRAVTKGVLKSIDFTSLKEPVYTSLVLALLGNGFSFMGTLTYLSSYGIARGYSESTSYLLIVAFNALSIPGRVIPSFLSDIYGRFNVLCLICISSTVAFFVLWMNSPVGHSLPGLFIFASFYGFTSGSVLSLTPTCIGQISETKDFGKRAGTAFFILSFGDLFGIPIGGAIIGSEGTREDYDHLVLFLSLMSLFGTIGALVARYLYSGFKITRV